VLSILRRPLRTLLTALGTILGVGALVATNGLAETARAQVSSRFDALAATAVRVEDNDPDGANPFPADASTRLERLNGVTAAGVVYSVPAARSRAPRASPAAQPGPGTPIPIIAADPDAITASRPIVATGRIYDTFHNDRHEHVAVLGRHAADQLDIARVDNRPAVFIGDHAYTVLGIIEDVDRNPELLNAVIIPRSTAQTDLPTAGEGFYITIDTVLGAAPLIGRQAPIALRPQDPERLHALVPPDPDTLRIQVSGDVTTLFNALAGLALLIGAIAIANASLLNVIERRSEIGLRRALGARRSHIRRQITLESALTGLTAGIVGATVAIIGLTIYTMSRGWTLTVDPVTMIASPIVGLLTGSIAGIIPAHRASQVAPATTMRE
jgi:putative ABC transport system permease protein